VGVTLNGGETDDKANDMPSITLRGLRLMCPKAYMGIDAYVG